MPIKTAGTKQQSAELEHERLRSLINSMADGVIATDERSKILLYNGAALNILDLNSSTTGKAISSVMRLVDHNNQPVNLSQLILNTKTSRASRDYRLLYPDGNTLSLYLSVAPVHLGYGNDGMRGYVLLFRDITREKSLEEERDEFISVVSHELRTPVTIAEGNISNALYMVKKQGITTVLDALKQAHDQIIFLSSLINDLSTLSRAEHDKLSVDVEPINTHKLVSDLAKNYADEAAAKGLKLETSLDPRLELLQSSLLYVREILQNFITNALKYTESGQVVIGAQQRPNGVNFWVQDTGIGISKSDQEKVFDKFFRSEDYRTRQSSGTGLGLYVTLKLARLIHAELDVQSELNKGSTFRIFVPNLK